MNQEILIVFTFFLLVTILLMLLLSDAKAKSSRIHVLVYVSGNPTDSRIMGNINSFLEKIASEDNFVFTLTDKPDPENFHSSDSYSVILKFQPYAFTGGGKDFNEILQPAAQATPPIHPDEYSRASGNNQSSIWTDANNPNMIYIAAGPDASACNNPGFQSRVRNAILQAAR